MAFLDCPRGHRVESETRAFEARARLVRWILPLESERLKNPTATARNNSPGGTDSLPETLKLLVVSNRWRRGTSFFQVISVIAAIFLAKVKHAIVGFLPLASKAS